DHPVLQSPSPLIPRALMNTFERPWLKLFTTSLFVLIGASAACPADPIADKLPKAIPLWPQRAPGATGDSDEDTPAIYPFLPSADKNTGASILVCPGGGFTNRAM